MVYWERHDNAISSAISSFIMQLGLIRFVYWKSPSLYQWFVNSWLDVIVISEENWRYLCEFNSKSDITKH